MGDYDEMADIGKGLAVYRKGSDVWYGARGGSEPIDPDEKFDLFELLQQARECAIEGDDTPQKRPQVDVPRPPIEVRCMGRKVGEIRDDDG